MKQACVAEVSKMLGRELTKAEQDTIEGHFNAATKQFIAEDRAGFQAMSPAQRTTEIATRAQNLALQSATERSDALVHQAMVEHSNVAMLDRVADKTKAISFVRDLVSQNAGSKAGVTSLETLAKATHYNAMRRLQGLLNMDGGKFFGLMANPERRAAALRAASGDATNDPVANAVGKAVADVNKELIAQAKAAGVSIHENPLWHRPQVDDVTRIRATPIDTWVSEVASLVDREVMLDGTGRPNTPQALDKYLREIYETKAMDGVNKRAAGAGQSGVGVSRVGSLNKERQLYFKDTDSYLSYMDKYADYQTAGEMFDAHYKRMSMDIALAQKFGANAPKHIEELLSRAHDAALRAAGTDVKAAGKIDKEAAVARREVANLLTPQAPADSRVAVALTTARNLSGAALLGNGVLSAIPDAATLKIMAQLTDIPQARLYKSFFKASLTKKDDLTAHGIFLAAATEHLGRWGVETLGSKATHVTSWLSNAVQGASGLHLWDKMGRAAWSEGIMWKVGEVTRTMADVAEFNKNSVFAQQGVTQHIFDMWRAADLSVSPINKSDRMLTPDAIYSIPDAKVAQVFTDSFGRKPTATEINSARSDAAIKLLSLAYDTEQSAFRGAMGANNSQRVATPLSQADPNTFAGQLGKCFMQFKSVPLGIFRTQFLEVPRMLEGQKGPLGMSAAAWHRAKFVTYTTLLGGLAEQLKSMARGEQPKDMTDPVFPLLALATGGGLGFYAETMKASFDAKGAGDVLSQFSGPVPNAAARMLAEFGKAAKDNAEGKGKTSDVYAQHGLKWARQNVAVGANVFWWKAAFNRMIYDQAQDYFVPGTSQEQEKRSNARGTEYWWSPGHEAPDRDIDLSRAFGEGN